MATKKAVYSVEVKADQGKAQAEAKRLAAIFRNELSKISVGTTTKGSAGSSNIVAAAKQAQAQTWWLSFCLLTISLRMQLHLSMV